MLKETHKIILGSITLGAMLSFFFLAVLVGPLVTWITFNYIAPIFNLRQIHFLEAFALYILINTLTGWFKYRGK